MEIHGQNRRRFFGDFLVVVVLFDGAQLRLDIPAQLPPSMSLILSREHLYRHFERVLQYGDRIRGSVARLFCWRLPLANGVSGFVAWFQLHRRFTLDECLHWLTIADQIALWRRQRRRRRIELSFLPRLRQRRRLRLFPRPLHLLQPLILLLLLVQLLPRNLHIVLIPHERGEIF